MNARKLHNSRVHKTYLLQYNNPLKNTLCSHMFPLITREWSVGARIPYLIETTVVIRVFKHVPLGRVKFRTSYSQLMMLLALMHNLLICSNKSHCNDRHLSSIHKQQGVIMLSFLFKWITCIGIIQGLSCCRSPLRFRFGVMPFWACILLPF